MIEKIVQLGEREYSQLCDKACLNEIKIRRLAEEYYQERGVFRIDVRTGVDKNRSGDFVYYTDTFSYENGLCKKNGFLPIFTEKGRRKIESMANRLCKEAFESTFGDAVKFRNRYIEALSRMSHLKLVLYGVAFSGWGAAAALLALLLLR